MKRDEIVNIARAMLGTPFKVGMSLKGVGCDCAGLLEIIMQRLGQYIPPRNIALPDALKIALLEAEKPNAGDVVLLKSTSNPQDFHCGIFTNINTIIHSHWSQGVVENTYGNWFKKRVVSFYSFKGVE